MVFQDLCLEDCLLPGLPGSSYNQGVCYLGATEAQCLLAPLQQLTESISPPRLVIRKQYWCHGLVTTERSGDHFLCCQELPPLVAPRNHWVCSEHYSQLTNRMTSSGPILVTEWNGMNSNLLKYTATDIKDLLLDYIDISACDTS